MLLGEIERRKKKIYRFKLLIRNIFYHRKSEFSDRLKCSLHKYEIKIGSEARPQFLVYNYFFECLLAQEFLFFVKVDKGYVNKCCVERLIFDILLVIFDFLSIV